MSGIANRAANSTVVVPVDEKEEGVFMVSLSPIQRLKREVQVMESDCADWYRHPT